MSALQQTIDARGIATLRLMRPERHNAFDDALIGELRAALADLASRPHVRALVLASSGRSFSAGADLDWMRRMAAADEAANRADAEALASMLHALDRFPRPTLALVQGPAYGGGVGLVACCDVAIATPAARFALTEVRLGLTPATISPYVIDAIGPRWARRLFLTAETLPAEAAAAIGLVHEVVEADALEAAGERVLGLLLQGAPQAQEAAKALVFWRDGRAVDAAYGVETSRRIAARRGAAEGREGIAAFLEKRAPSWRSG